MHSEEILNTDLFTLQPDQLRVMRRLISREAVLRGTIHPEDGTFEALLRTARIGVFQESRFFWRGAIGIDPQKIGVSLNNRRGFEGVVFNGLRSPDAKLSQLHVGVNQLRLVEEQYSGRFEVAKETGLVLLKPEIDPGVYHDIITGKHDGSKYDLHDMPVMFVDPDFSGQEITVVTFDKLVKQGGISGRPTRFDAVAIANGQLINRRMVKFA